MVVSLFHCLKDNEFSYNCADYRMFLSQYNFSFEEEKLNRRRQVYDLKIRNKISKQCKESDF